MKLKSALLVSLLLFLSASTVKAGCNFATNGTTSIMTASCSFDGTDDGIDAGTGTNNISALKISGGTLSILGNQTIGLGKITLTGGSLAIIDGGKVALNRIIYYIDKDNDGYSTSLIPSSGTFGNLTPTPVGLKRKSAYTPAATADCNDGSALVKIAHAACYKDMDNDGYTNTNAGTDPNTTCTDNTTCNTSMYASASTDNAAVGTYTYGQMKAASTTHDCGDGDNRAYPNEPTYYGGTFMNNVTGAQSYDWNCSGANDILYPQIWACNTTGCASHYFTITAGFAANPGCGANGTWKTYAGAGGAACSINIAGAYTSCPAGTTSTVQQLCR